ncbi:hypothetical protein SAMN05661012_02778 [Chitinophaga sancti]|uniref:Uncharacterized protein n=1 Tax=Chitinophaga sancti TaxID=1004 RepID=A0A1K1QK04_9BACT|nr:hypothetical protein SAMN05661012_02778 [Chitinophaga sancti]
MKQTNNPNPKKTLTLNKLKVSLFNSNVFNPKSGNKFHFTFVMDTTGSANCNTSITK